MFVRMNSSLSKMKKQVKINPRCRFARRVLEPMDSHTDLIASKKNIMAPIKCGTLVIDTDAIGSSILVTLSFK
ncbi:MAG: hypothetical protein BM565_12320 [Gammaproteobacteria bacterium MedPE]|nr:MAG: hypothetical protein BM565_12320 [Gammaproteobacteria bacterium MedPE]